MAEASGLGPCELGGDFTFERKHGGQRSWTDDDGLGGSAFGDGHHRDRGDDDLLWAALEKLPTYRRLRTTLLEELEAGDQDQGSTKHVMDVSSLTRMERQRIIERAFATTDQDNETLVARLRERIQAVGVQIPRVEVRFQNLRVSADAYVGSRALPTLVNFVRNITEGLLAASGVLASKKREIHILKDVSGVVKPGRTMLLLGPPGSGKSTLLRALAGKLDQSLKTTGAVTYNGHTLDEFEARRTSSYISQEDDHIGELTVRETLDFAARCQGVGFTIDLLMELLRREKRENIRPDPCIDAFMKLAAVEGARHSVRTNYVMKVLGLEICADTVVGSDMLRGVSGGQKKRVTTGEMIVGPKKTLFMDEISTGLDSSTTFQIVRCVRNFAHSLEGTVLMALLQPPPETFELFDDVLLLAEGHIVYLGPREHILDFFASLGFQLPPRKAIADFLQEVTSRKDQQQYWADETRPYSYVPVATIARAFKGYEVGKDLGLHLGSPFEKESGHPAALTTTKYGIPRWEMFKACTEREWLLIKRNRFLYTFRTAQVAFMAFVAGTLFLRTRIHPDSESDGNLYLATLFYALVHMMFNGFSEMAITVHRLPVFYKQRDNLFFPGWAFSLPSWLLRIPYSVIEGVIWSCIVYYTVGLDPQPQRFFRYMFLLVLMHQMALAMFRFIGAVGRNMIVANTFGSFGILIVFLLGGFVIDRTHIPGWWIWAYWLSPLSYAENALAVNEFGASRWDKSVHGDDGKLYVKILKPRGLFVESYWYWIGIAVLVGYIVLLQLLGTLALSYLNPLRKPQAVVSEESLREMADNDAEVRESPVAIEVLPVSNGGGGVTKGMILPFQPLALTFQKVCYFVDVPAEMRAQGVTEDRLQLLRDVSGAFRPGVLTALVGVSGAGKTTLMDVLAGRKTGGYIQGDVRVSGFPKLQKTFARISGYVEQTDIHSPQVTVYESLVYSAWLRLPAEVDAATRYSFVEKVMELVELGNLRNALLGLPGTSGLSTEQRKRLTIAVELVANPSIIFLDEPTSGLDARAAAIVMRTVRNTVDTGRTVVCTIHQPSIDIFESFDELLLMTRGGRAIYVGPLGLHSKTMIDYFQSIPGVPPLREGYNPATWMLEVTSPSAELRLGQAFADIFQNSMQYQNNEKLIESLSSPAPGSKDLEFPTKYSLDFWSQCRACLWKQHLTYWRNPYYNVVRLFFTLVCALIFGSIFWGVGRHRETQQDVFNAMGVLFAAVVFLGVNNASSVQPVVSVERTVFYRERAAGMYSPLPYAFAQGAIELPYIFVQTLLYGVVTYGMVQFELLLVKFLWYLFFMFVTLAYFTLYGMMAVGLTPSQQLASVVSSAFYSLWNLFSGFFIPKRRIPGWWLWFYYLNPVSWTIYGLTVSQLGDVEDEIGVGDGLETMSVKEFLERYFGFEEGFVGVCAMVILGFMLLFWLVFAFSIKFINFQRR
ncbi:ABC transporter G family member 31 [Selaginella moellendorffii]|uniref:ABC transporter G family member 31 n=1 Tax=Selaginella moellendorffii TaxID=88036 RepID=UPI000D1C490E|nr:ABC transporter G family member 31 [Selaginella moellendorffii]|eukprot:XP_024525813.1 ABC transporter G family member 31 [Selaginella moellendorffii]